MKVIDLTAENESVYFVCLEDWSDEMREAGDHKERWYRSMKDRGHYRKTDSKAFQVRLRSHYTIHRVFRTERPLPMAKYQVRYDATPGLIILSLQRTKS